MGREARAVGHRNAGTADRSLNGPRDVAVAGEAQAAALGVTHTQALHRGRGRRPFGNRFQSLSSFPCKSSYVSG
ncbi:unnamed protein product [[Actinomadura] parvosata subsp. kistnae]|nr:unnamed protein product [Actinomadura parvosata subsp. kistnae]